MQQQTAERYKVGVPSQGAPTPHIPLRAVLLHRYAYHHDNTLFVMPVYVLLSLITAQVTGILPVFTEKQFTITSYVVAGALALAAGVVCVIRAGRHLPAPVLGLAYTSRVVENVAV